MSIQERWEPSLLQLPRGARAAREPWAPVILRSRRPGTLVLLIVFLGLQFLIPARLVIGGLGAVGRPSVAIGILLVFLWVLSAIRPHELPLVHSQPIRWVIGGYVALQLFGYAVGLDRGLSSVEGSSALRWVIFTVAMAGIALATADGVSTRQQLDRLLLAMTGFAAVMSFVGVLQFAEIVDLTDYIQIPGLHENTDLIDPGERGPGFARIASTANHYIEFGVVMALILPIAMHYALFSPPGLQRYFRWAAMGLIAVGIPLSISRSAVLAIVVGMGLMAVIWRWRQRYNALVLAMLATAVFHVIQPGVLGTIKSLFLNLDNDPSVQDRIERSGYVFNLWAQRPWVGRGAGTMIPEEYILLDNQWYVTLLAGGIIGVGGLALFFLVPYLMGRSIRLRGDDQETRHLAQALAVAMPIAVLVSGTFDSFSFVTFVGVIFIIIGAIGALWRLDRTSPTKPMQAAAPDDRFVTSPLAVSWRDRHNVARRS